MTGIKLRRWPSVQHSDEAWRTRTATLESQVKSLEEALRWIATVNESIDMRKLEPKDVISLVHELRGRAKHALLSTPKEKA